MKPLAALLKKEFVDEFRSKSGLLTSLLFCIVIVIALSQSTTGRTLSGTLSAGLLWAGYLFASALSLPRTMVHEDEKGTADLLRLWTTPQTVFWAKAIFNGAQMVGLSSLMTILFVGMSSQNVTNWPVLLLGTIGGSLALSGTLTLTGALASQANQRSLLAGAIALPLVVPLITLGISAMRFAFGDGSVAAATSGTLGLWLYAVASHAIGPVIFDAVWKS